MFTDHVPIYLFDLTRPHPITYLDMAHSKWRVGGQLPTQFIGRIEGAAGKRRCAALIHCSIY